MTTSSALLEHTEKDITPRKHLTDDAYELGVSDVLYDGACNWGVYEGCKCPLCYAAYQKGVADGYALLMEEQDKHEPKEDQNTSKDIKLSDHPAFGAWKGKRQEGVEYKARYTDEEL